MSSAPAQRPARAVPTPVPLGRLAALIDVPCSAPDTLVTGVTHDSAGVRPGDLFAALPGARAHGAAFLPDAVQAGAVAVLTDPGGSESAVVLGVPALVVADPRAVLGELAAEVHGRPAEHLLTLGVTGTNGKTTTAHLLHEALGAAGRSPGLVGTVETRVGSEVLPSVRTTPEATDLQALLALMRERGADSVAMELSSIAVRMGRVDALPIDVVGFTNLTQDHLDFHVDMPDYFAAKADLFTPGRARTGVVLVDSEPGRRLADSADIPVVTVATAGGTADWTVDTIRALPGGDSTFRLVGPAGERAEAKVALPGRFNVDNAALAIVMLVTAGLDLSVAVEGVASCTRVPGRMEPVDEGQPFAAVVDYAHTPGAVESLLAALRDGATGRLLLVLGCGGDRDTAKRPLMGRAGAQGADLLVVADDNPRSEDPAAIRAAVVEGARSVPVAERAEVLEVGDRAAAIRTVVRAARPGDVVVVAGKGHEPGQDVGGVVTPFDDRAELRQALRELGGVS